MAITSISDVHLRKPFLHPDGSLWEVQSFCDRPTVTMVNSKTGDTIGGAVGCLNLADFIPITSGCPDGLLAVADEKGGSHGPNEEHEGSED